MVSVGRATPPRQSSLNLPMHCRGIFDRLAQISKWPLQHYFGGFPYIWVAILNNNKTFSIDYEAKCFCFNSFFVLSRLGTDTRSKQSCVLFGARFSKLAKCFLQLLTLCGVKY